MEKNEYLKLKEWEMSEAIKTVEVIQNSADPTVRYKDSRPITDIKNMLETSCSLYADNTAFWVKKNKKQPYEPVTYKELLSDVNSLGTALIKRGFKGKKIAVIGANSYQWAVSYLAAVCGVGVVVPLDKELSANELKQLLIESETSCVLMAKKHLKDFVEMKKSGETSLELLVNMDAAEDTEEAAAFGALLKEGKALMEQGDTSFTETQIIGNEMSILLFTSGTTGISKGVMLSHRNICEDLMIAPTVLHVTPKDIFFSVLPLHHTYECTCGFLMPLYKGAAIAHCEGLKHIVNNLSEVRPTFFLGVPAIFEMLYKKIWTTARKNGKDKALKKAIKINRLSKKIGIDLSQKLFKDVLKVFGGRMHMMISGGAAINPEVLDGFMDFGIIALQGYGLTEAAPMGALNPDTCPNSRAVGRAFPNCELRIDSPDENGIGEICIKGANIMLGYYKRLDLTEEVIRDGWFYTGDLGYIDDAGYLYITGRRKNVIITKNGKNVFPEELEYYLSNIPLVEESVVFGKDGALGDDIVIAAYIKPDEEAVQEVFNCSVAEADEDALLKALWEEVDKINKENPLFKQIKQIKIRKEPFIKNSSNKIRRFEEGNKF